MAWVVIAPEDSAVIEGIEKQSDRSAAIIGAAYLERKLGDAIKSRLRRHKKTEDKLFTGYGPLATFSARSDLALLLGIIPPIAHTILGTIRQIRNEFAHTAEPRDFESARIADLCGNLGPGDGAKVPDGLNSPEVSEAARTAMRSLFRTPSDHRERYLLNVQFVAFLLFTHETFQGEPARRQRIFDALINKAWRKASRERSQSLPPHRRKGAGHGRKRRKRQPQSSRA